MKRLLFLLFCLAIFNTHAQSIHAYETSNGAGVFASGFNPAGIADSPFRWQFNLGLANSTLGGDNESYKISNPFIPLSKFEINYLGKPTHVSQTILNGPAFLFQTHKWGTIALSTKLWSRQSSSDIETGIISTDIFINKSGVNFKYEASSIKQLNIGYAYPLSFKAHHLKLGINLSSYSGYYFDQIEISKSGNDIFKASGLNNQLGNKFAWNDVIKMQDATAALNYGFIYEYRPKYQNFAYDMDGKQRFDPTANKYLFKVGLSLINNNINKAFDKSNIVSVQGQESIANLKNKKWDGDYFDILGNFNLQNGNSASGSTQAYNSQLNIFADVALGKRYRWFMKTGLAQTTNTVMKNNIAFVMPRYDFEDIEFALPITYNSFNQSYGMGIHLKIGAIVFGAESLNSFISKKNAPSFYLGLQFYKLGRRIKDRDNDSVSDSKDKCIDVPGLWIFKGCPDTDLDGIENSKDKCPENAGPIETGGCPDADGDGIFDNVDACPNQAGLAKFNGCPDTDGDGIMDSEDECPTVAGTEEFNGCPDTDGDGIKDSDDKCPTEKGTKENQGCPVKRQ